MSGATQVLLLGEGTTLLSAVNTRLRRRRVQLDGLVVVCLLFAGVVVSIGMNRTLGALLLLGSVLQAAENRTRWVTRRILELSRRLPNRIPAPTVSALIALYSAAMGNDRDAYDTAATSPDLRDAELRPDIAALQFTVLVSAAGGMTGSSPTPQQWADLIRKASASRAVMGQLIAPDTAREVLARYLVGDTAPRPDLSDYLDYIGRVMPTIVALTAYAYSRSSPAAKSWPRRLHKTVRLYEQHLQYRIRRPA